MNNEIPKHMLMPKKQPGWQFWLGMAVSLLFLYFAVRQVDWGEFTAALMQAHLLLLALGALVQLGAFVVVGARWRVLLKNTVRISVVDGFDFYMIGYLAGLVIPARLGDLARAVFLGRYKRVNLGPVLSSMILDRVLDVVMLLLLGVGLSFLFDFPAFVHTAILILAGVIVVVIVVIFLLARTQDRLVILLSRLLEKSRLPDRFADSFVNFARRFADGLQTVRDGRQLGTALLLALLGWVLAGCVMTIYVAAFDLPAPWFAGLFVFLVINLGGIIPSSPGGIGVYHYLAVLALSLWMPEKGAALGYAVAAHGINMLLFIIFGGWALIRKGLSLRGVRMLSMTKVADEEAL